MSRAGEDGYALVAAVASIAVFAGIALAAASATRISLDTGRAEIVRAQAAAAADAGVALGIAGLLARTGDRWSIDGRPRTMAFGSARLTIRLQDERGKIPINRLDDELAEHVLAAAGLEGQPLAVARDSLLDWIDDDDDARPNGAEAAYYAPQGIQPRNGALVSIGELGRVRGFDRALVARLAPYITVTSGSTSFDPSFASAFAINAMGDEAGATRAIEESREEAGQRTAIALTDDVNLVGRPVSIVVDADADGGGHAHRVAVVELTGAAIRPYVIRSYE